jgi:hypothetical protein
MAAPVQPDLLPQPFANNATGGFKNTIPDTTVTSGRASYDIGFPPITMQDVIAGGIPPLGQDVNGILFAISSHTYYQQTGKPYAYNSALATAMGGYAVGTLLGMSDGTGLWLNNSADNTTDPDGGSAAGWVPAFSYGATTVAVTGGTLTLTAAQARRSLIIVTGVLTSNQTINIPARLGRWIVANATSGAFSLTVKTPAGTGVAVPQGGLAAPTEVYSDGTNLYNAVAPVNLPIDQAATPLTIAQRTNSGYLLATYFNQSSPLENFTANAVFAQASSSDGYLRKISLANLAAQIALSSFAGQVTAGQVPVGAVTQYTAQILANAALTGTPTTPTAATGTNTTQVASTAFVQASVQANQTKIAGGRILSGSLASGSTGITSVTFLGTGWYQFNVTAAGFTSAPFGAASITGPGTNPDTATVNVISATTVQVRTTFGNTPVTRDFTFILSGT